MILILLVTSRQQRGLTGTEQGKEVAEVSVGKLNRSICGGGTAERVSNTSTDCR